MRSGLYCGQRQVTDGCPFSYLHNAVSGLQRSVPAGGTVLQDVLDEDAPHHLAVAKATAHASPPHDADPQRLPVLSVQLHSGGKRITIPIAPGYCTTIAPFICLVMTGVCELKAFIIVLW